MDVMAEGVSAHSAANGGGDVSPVAPDQDDDTDRFDEPTSVEVHMVSQRQFAVFVGEINRMFRMIIFLLLILVAASIAQLVAALSQ